MKTNKKIAVFVLTIAFSLIIIIDSVQSNQTYAIFEKSDFLLPEGKSRFVQEKSKYHYVGIEKCASICHNNEEMGFQYNIVKNSPHSKAFKILASERAMRYAKNANVKENPQESSVCLKCHVTGGGLDSSSFTSTYKKDDGITCEACHKGEYITKTFLPKEIDCLKCHNDSVHKMHKFDFNDKCAKIAHPRPKAKQKTLIRVLS
ncbi:MAG: multiheme c-type cytochrome [Bacteroidia bacterium]|nr:multiheme c-type cytochrome [Bacteroidia bacterium]